MFDEREGPPSADDVLAERVAFLESEALTPASAMTGRS